MQRSNSWPVFIPILLFAVVFSACGGSSTPKKELTAEERKKMEGFDALDSKRAEYTTIPAKEQLAKEPYMKKKLLVFGYDPTENDKKYAWRRNYFGTDKMGSTLYSKDYEALEFKLAKNPEEVGIIALIPECKSVDGGKYSAGGSSISASKERCEVLLIDPELSAVVYRRVFEAEMDSSKTVSGGQTSVSSRVDGKTVIAFLDSIKSKD
jgi:hypothetical protein